MGTGAEISEMVLARNTFGNCVMVEDFNFPHTN